MSKKRLFLFRHGETDWNREERFQGHVDIPLNAKGFEQARALIKPLRHMKIEVILSSDLSRAHQTAKVVADHLGIEVHPHPGIREAHLGKAQGLTRHEIETLFGMDSALHWGSNLVSDADVSYPGGETGRAVLERTRNSILEFIRKSPFSRIGISTHGGVMRRLVHSILQDPTQHVPIPNGVLYELQADPHSGLFELSNFFEIKTKNLEFRPINLEKHLNWVIRFRENAHVCSFGSSEKFWIENGPHAERYIEWLQKKLNKDPFSAVHVWQGDRIIGQIELGAYKHDPSIGYINLYYLIPEARGSGLAHLLDEYAVQYLRTHGHTKARLSVSPTNLRAIRFYTRLGWTDIGVRPDAPEVHLMEKRL